MYLIELALTGDWSSELKDLSEDLSLLGLQTDSVELQGGDFTLTSDSVEGVMDFSLGGSTGSSLFEASFVFSDSTERIVRVLESELTEDDPDLSTWLKSLDSEERIAGVGARLEVIESGPIVSPELKDLALSGVLGLNFDSC